MKFTIGDTALCDGFGQMRRSKPFGDRHRGEQPYRGEITDIFHSKNGPLYYIREGMFPGWFKERYLKVVDA